MSELPEKLMANRGGFYGDDGKGIGEVNDCELAAEIVRRYNAFEGDQKKIKDLLAACKPLANIQIDDLNNRADGTPIFGRNIDLDKDSVLTVGDVRKAKVAITAAEKAKGE